MPARRSRGPGRADRGTPLASATTAPAAKGPEQSRRERNQTGRRRRSRRGAPATRAQLRQERRRGAAGARADIVHPNAHFSAMIDCSGPPLKFPQTFIDEVRAAADIVTVISDSVSLRKAGNSYKGLCPFHGEKTPSFNVMRERGFFHCYGCGVGGDVFKFVELQEKVGFQDAVRHLAARFGIPIPDMESTGEQGETAAEREALVKIHEVALAYFREQLAAPGGAKIRRSEERRVGKEGKSRWPPENQK